MVDDYVWLENFNDPAVQAWTAAENRLSRAWLDRASARPRVAHRLEQLYAATPANYSELQTRPGLIFAMKFLPPAQQPMLVTLRSPEYLASERVVLDPNQIGGRGATTIDFAVPSHDGSRVAVSLSENGSEDGTLSILDGL